jgi:hypothetical protein
MIKYEECQCVCGFNCVHIDTTAYDNIGNETDTENIEDVEKEDNNDSYIEDTWEHVFILCDSLLSSNSNILLSMKNPSFHDDFNTMIYTKTKIPLEDIIEITKSYFESHFTLRSETTTSSYKSNTSLTRQIMARNNKLNKKCANQGTPEWFVERSKYITASSAYKCLEDPSKTKYREKFIKDKVETIVSLETMDDKAKWFSINLENPMELGHRYEQAVINVYSFLNNTNVSEYGCIPHKTHSFLAASPDGINNNPQSSLYGRMLEIKCVKSRKITGIPKKDYWVQMQHQMECCDLEEVDFVETKPTVISQDEFERNVCAGNSSNMYHGTLIIMQCKTTNYPLYLYYPFNVSYNLEDIKEWSDNIFNKYSNTYNFIDHIYYKFEVFSIVLVRRNREWFKEALPYYQEVWEEVLKRVDTYESKTIENENNTLEIIKLDI